MQETMKALVKSRAEPGLWLENVPVPTARTNEALIKIHKTGICGTDLHIYNWDDWAQRNIAVPRVIGHEFVGEIVAMGPLPGIAHAPRSHTTRFLRDFLSG